MCHVRRPAASATAISLTADVGAFAPASDEAEAGQEMERGGALEFDVAGVAGLFDRTR